MSETQLQTAPSTAETQLTRFVELVQGIDAIVWEMDVVTWRFTFVSDRAIDILGYPVSQWLNEPNFWQDRILHPEDRNWCVNFCAIAINEGREGEFQYRAIASDGRIVFIKDVVRVVKDECDRPKLLRGLMVDITNCKDSIHGVSTEKSWQLSCERAAGMEVETVQSALRKSEQRYRSLIEATAQIIWDTKAEGELVTPQPGWSAFT